MYILILLINVFILYIVAKKDSKECMQGYVLGQSILGSIIFWAGVGISKLL